MSIDTKEPAREKQRRYRERMRAKGLRPKQIWVYDTRDPAFIAECQRQARIAAQSSGEKEILDFIADTYDWDSW